MYYTQRLKEVREYYEMTQEEVANGIGVKRQQYRRYENGENEIKAGHIIKLCKLYDLAADYILGITNIQKEMPKR